MKADAAKIRTEMFNRGISQREMALKTGISRNTINKICTGRECGLDTICKVARIIGKDPKELIVLEEADE